MRADVAEALDPDYQAKNDPEKLVFVEKQKYMCAVATRTLLTDKGNMTLSIQKTSLRPTVGMF